MTEENLKWLENVFRRTVGDNGEIRLQDFKNIVHSKNVSTTLDAFFRQIKSFRRFCLAFGFGLQTFYMINFS